MTNFYENTTIRIKYSYHWPFPPKCDNQLHQALHMERITSLVKILPNISKNAHKINQVQGILWREVIKINILAT